MNVTTPSWYGAPKDPTWKPGLSPDMERGMAEEKLHAWHSVGKGVADDYRPSLFAAWLCSCFYYAHTSDRVNAAGSLNTGDSVARTPPSYRLSRACCGFLACLPFYGFLIGGMQAFVRLFYGIEGSHEQDFVDGCFCPCRTMNRLNDEMIFRDQPGPIREKASPIASSTDQVGYLPNPVMTYRKPLSAILEEPPEGGRLPS